MCGKVTESPGKSEEGLFRPIGCVKAPSLEKQESWRNGSLDKGTKG